MFNFLANSRKKLLNFKYFYKNGYYIETMKEDNVKYFYITPIISNQKLIIEKLATFFYGSKSSMT